MLASARITAMVMLGLVLAGNASALSIWQATGQPSDGNAAPLPANTNQMQVMPSYVDSNLYEVTVLEREIPAPAMVKNIRVVCYVLNTNGLVPKDAANPRGLTNMKSRLILHTSRESAQLNPLQGAISFNLTPTASAPLGTAAGGISTYFVEYALELPTTPLPQGRYFLVIVTEVQGTECGLVESKLDEGDDFYAASAVPGTITPWKDMPGFTTASAAVTFSGYLVGHKMKARDTLQDYDGDPNTRPQGCTVNIQPIINANVSSSEAMPCTNANVYLGLVLDLKQAVKLTDLSNFGCWFTFDPGCSLGAPSWRIAIYQSTPQKTAQTLFEEDMLARRSPQGNAVANLDVTASTTLTDVNDFGVEFVYNDKIHSTKRVQTNLDIDLKAGHYVAVFYAKNIHWYTWCAKADAGNDYRGAWTGTASTFRTIRGYWDYIASLGDPWPKYPGWSGTVGTDIWCQVVPDVNTAHFEALFRDWGKVCDQNCPPREADRNGDGRVNFADYSLFLADWDPKLPGIKLPAPVAHWKFDETSGTTASDSAGSNHGTVSGASWVPGVLGNALGFDGVDDYVDCGTSSALAPAPTITLSLWVNHKVVPGKGYFIRRATGGWFDVTYAIGPHPTTRKVQALFGNGSKMILVTSANIAPAGEWMHILYSRDGKEAVLYVNGADRTTTSYSTAPFAGTAPCEIGRSSSYFAGSIDDVRIFDVILTEEQIAALVSGTAE